MNIPLHEKCHRNLIKKKKEKTEPDVIRTRNLLIWSQTRYRCATGPPIQHMEYMQNAYNTRDSQAVTHPSTNRARRCLTSVIRREPVYSTWYGRRQREKCKMEGRDKYKDSFDGLFHCISITAVIV